MVLKTARRYANALLQISIEQNKLETILKDVELIHNTVEGSRELKLFMKSPIIKSDEKRAVLHELFGNQTDSLTVQFLDLVVKKGRESLLDQIMQGFIERYKQHAKIIDVNVYSASALRDDTLQKLNQTLESITGKSVDLHFHIDESLKGGLAVRVDDTIIDGTVKHKIDQLKTLFLETAV
jgi:F-type H+-transporting ATPase subunit delta